MFIFRCLYCYPILLFHIYYPYISIESVVVSGIFRSSPILPDERGGASGADAQVEEATLLPEVIQPPCLCAAQRHLPAARQAILPRGGV